MSEQRVIDVEHTDTFGNYLMHGIDEIVLPPAVSWWPAAPGWQVLAILLAAGSVWLVIRIARRWWHNRYRRAAVRRIDEYGKGKRPHQAVAVLPFIIKATALHAYPRQEVASLSGPAWLRFLDEHYPGPAFSQGLGEKLVSIAYLPEQQWNLDDEQSKALMQMVRQWITSHREIPHV